MSFVSAVTDGTSKRLVWVDLNDVRNSKRYQPEISLHYKNSLICRETTSIIQFQHGPISSLVNNVNSDKFLDHASTVTLDYSTPYHIYWFILFADEFKEKKSSNNVRSICGIYLIAVGVSYHTCGSLGSVRIMTLVTHEQEPNDALNI